MKPPTYPYPPAFVQNTLDIHPEKGRAWLDQLPELLGVLEERWAFRVLPPFDNLSYFFVAPVVRADGSPAVIKMWVPDPEVVSEISALRLYNGRGIVRLLESDTQVGAFLLERLLPGEVLSSLKNDDEESRIAAGIMRELWIPAPSDPDHIFPTTARWSKGLERLRAAFDGGTGPFPAHLVAQAERLFAELESSTTERMLLHGDLHHWNILSAERQPWLALDPKGCIGDPAYEAAQMLLNNHPEGIDQTGLRRLTDRRVSIFQEVLGIDRRRMLGWTLAKAMLSSWWTYEDHHRVWSEADMLAEAINELLD